MKENRVPDQKISGIVGFWNTPEAARKVYFGLHSILHRGSDGVGIACSNGEEIETIRGEGLLSEVISEKALEELKGNLACGQIRTGERKRHLENQQPKMVNALEGQFCVVSSGMLSNAQSLREQMSKEGLIFQGTSDAEVIAHLIQKEQGSMAQRIIKSCEIMKGPITFMVMTKNTLYAFRSADGIRPLFMAKLDEGLAVASETAAFSMVETSLIDEIPPGSLLCMKKKDVDLIRIQGSEKNTCAMEYIYYSRADSLYKGKSVHNYRKQMGKALAENETVDADIVIGVPDTAISAAMGFAEGLKKPYEIGLIKNRYIGSTFVQPLAEQRKSGMRVRLNAISSIVKGKKVYLVDDSIKKGETAKRISQLLREAGAKEVHLRIASPRMEYTCYYGTELIEPKHLAAANYSDEEMCELFHANSIRFLDEDKFRTILPENSCIACINGVYPSPLYDFGQKNAVDNSSLEQE